MSESTRDLVLSKLKSAPESVSIPRRPQIPPMNEESMETEQLVERFKTLLEAQTGVLKRARGAKGVLAALAEVFEEEKISKAMASTDTVVMGLDLPGWAKEIGYSVITHQAFDNRKTFKDAVFTEVEAGITGADYGFAESATLCLAADMDMPRLTSLAPMVHIAVLPIERLFPTYEHMVGEVLAGPMPSQLICITGPSATADIQATSFKGMHGPGRLIVILRE